ncbi:MAG: PD40 domain-containing protein [Deltaproteobacteria bacterium]|nr:PD40 domain-containing protein [Deltaproteobacteria bacterium]
MTRCNLHRAVFAFAVLLLPLLAGVSSAANYDTSFKFSTIETEHFSIHFHQGLDDIAQRTARIAEDAHARLSVEFNWSPLEKTQIIIADDSDFANGAAGVLPYNVIYVQPSPPGLDTAIGEYEDWLSILIIHEYTHILTMDAGRGYSRLARKVFGKPLPGGGALSLLAFISAAPPNVFLPRWWLEGVAVWSETENTNAGRGRSAYYEMISRMAVVENNLPPVDRIGGEAPDWPDGHSPYIFGMRLQKYIADKYGPDALGMLSMGHAGRYPYLLNGVAERKLKGKNYVALYYDMLADLRKEEKGQIEILRQTPLTPFTELPLEGELLTNPRYSPDGRMIAYNRQDPHGHEAVWIANRDGSGPHEAARRRYSDHAISWSPDGKTIYFTQAEVANAADVYSDLYAYDVAGCRVKRLTYGKRIKEADVSPDGKTIAAVVSERGSQNLVIMEKNTAETIIPFFAPPAYREPKRLTDYKEERVSGPRWSPDGGRIAYVLTDNAGRSSLNVYDANTQRHERFVEGAFAIGYPAWSKDGKFIIYTSSETSVFNLYACSLEGKKARQLSHLLGGAFQPDVSPDGKEMVFSSYRSTGWKIATMPFDPAGITASPTIKPYWNELPRTELDKARLRGYETGAAALPSRPYSALHAILPRFWLPTLTSDRDGGVLGAFTAGQDALAYNTYIAQAGYGLASGEGYYNAAYYNDYLSPTLIVKSSSVPVLYADLLRAGDYYERDTTLTLAASVPLVNLESYHNITFGYQLQRQDAQSQLTNGFWGGQKVFEGRRDNVFIGLDFSNSLKYPYSISREEGKTASVVYKYYSRAIGNDVHSKEFIANLSEYQALPFNGKMRHATLYLNLKGGASSGERIAQQAFQLGGAPGQSDFPLRGFPSRSSAGKFAGTGTMELRAPLWNIFGGPNTKPVFLEKLHGAAFADTGEVWDDDHGFALPRLKTGVGAEVRLDMALGYLFEITPAIGVARGLNKDGMTQVYFTIYSNL